MINKTIYVYFLFFLIFLTSCDQGKIKNSNQCLGEWKLLDVYKRQRFAALEKYGYAAPFNVRGNISGTYRKYKE